jgi:hypothetical protein
MRLDIAPFAHREQSARGTFAFRWEEPREIHRVELHFAEGGPLPPRRDIGIHYWRHHWPEERLTLTDLDQGGIGSFGWKPRDDWFNGEWRRADVTARAKGRSITVTFAPLGRREHPELREDYNVRFRQTMQLQVRLPEGSTPISRTAVLTDTRLRSRAITVELGCGEAAPPQWEGTVEVYNGMLESVHPPGQGVPRLHLRVACARPGPLSEDRTVITLRSSTFAVSFRPEDLDGGEPIWIPDFGVLISEANWRLGYEEFASRPAGVTRYQAVAQQPEQSLARAMREQPPKECMHFIVGCEGGRQKFGIAPTGEIFALAGFVRRVPGADTERLRWEGGGFGLRFGWDEWLPIGRRLARNYLPVLTQGLSRGAVDVRQEVFAAPLGQSILAGPIAADAPIGCFCRLTFTNNSARETTISQPLTMFTYPDGASAGYILRGQQAPLYREQLAVRGDAIWTMAPRRHLRMIADDGGRGDLAQAGDDLVYSVDLGPGENHSLVLKIPFLCDLEPAEIESLRGADFDAARAEVISHWEERLAQAAEVAVPDQDITDFCRSHLTHILVNDDREVGSERIMGRVSSFNYGNYSNETVMQIMELDRRGFHGEARRHLDTFLHYQGTVGLPGNFQSKDGVFYGSGGYEMGDYNQHHGWVLWGLAEHYRFTGDAEWVRKIGDALAAGCDWVAREREQTKRVDARGRKVLEYGFLPAGTLEDVRDYYYWLSTNCLTWRGLAAAAHALAEVRHPEGERLVREAETYREDLLAGYRESMARCPVVRLRDGSYVPHFPSRLYLRGRDIGWIREVLEGAICLTTTVLDPNSQESTWILKDYEDNLYLDAPFNYPLESFEREWFSRGGFSMQPNLLYFPPPYLYRDQIEHFLRAFFNGFAACWRRDIRAMTEHPLPTLSEWSGDHFKSSDEAMVAMWLRMMFIQEVGDTLYLGRGLPRVWLGSEEEVAIRNAATYCGRRSLAYRALEGGRRIVARIEPPTRRPPRQVIVRFRHPEKARLTGALVNGQAVDSFDADREWVVLPSLAEVTTVEGVFS